MPMPRKLATFHFSQMSNWCTTVVFRLQTLILWRLQKYWDRQWWLMSLLSLTKYNSCNRRAGISNLSGASVLYLCLPFSISQWTYDKLSFLSMIISIKSGVFTRSRFRGIQRDQRRYRCRRDPCSPPSTCRHHWRRRYRTRFRITSSWGVHQRRSSRPFVASTTRGSPWKSQQKQMIQRGKEPKQWRDSLFDYLFSSLCIW